MMCLVPNRMPIYLIDTDLFIHELKQKNYNISIFTLFLKTECLNLNCYFSDSNLENDMFLNALIIIKFQAFYLCYF